MQNPDYDTLWDIETPVALFDIKIPQWIAQDISPCTVASIIQGGCASGAYMPAVTYHTALATMAEHGDVVFEYIDSMTGEIPTPPDTANYWSGLACFYLSVAVELWASGIEEELCEAVQDRENETAITRLIQSPDG